MCQTMYHLTRLACAVVGVLMASLASPATAGTGRSTAPEQYCWSAAPSDLASFKASDAQLNTAASQSQKTQPRNQMSGSPGDWRDGFMLAQTDGAVPTAAALSRYCLTAANAALSSGQDQADTARHFLRSGIRYAAAVREDDQDLSDLAGSAAIKLLTLNSPAAAGASAKKTQAEDPCLPLKYNHNPRKAESDNNFTAAACLHLRWAVSDLIRLEITRRGGAEAAPKANFESAAVLDDAEAGDFGCPDQPDEIASLHCVYVHIDRAAWDAALGTDDPTTLETDIDLLECAADLMLRTNSLADVKKPPRRPPVTQPFDVLTSLMQHGAVRLSRQASYYHALAAQFEYAALPASDVQGRLSAYAELDEAIRLESTLDAPLNLARWYMIRADLRLEDMPRGDSTCQTLAPCGAYWQDPDYVRTVDEAFNALEITRPLFLHLHKNPLTHESNFTRIDRPVFEAQLDLRLRAAHADDAAAKAAGSAHDRERASLAYRKDVSDIQKTVEDFRQIEVQNGFADDCVPPAPSAGVYQLDAGETVVYPILLKDRLELLYAVAPSNADQANVAARRVQFKLLDDESLSATIQKLRENAPPDFHEQVLAIGAKLFEEMSNGREDNAAAETLYALLIAPLENSNLISGEGTRDGIATLIVIPDAGLSQIPFAALKKHDGGFVVDRAAVAVAPSLAFAQPGQRAAGNDVKIIGFPLSHVVTINEISDPFRNSDAFTTTVRSASGASSAKWQAFNIQHKGETGLDKETYWVARGSRGTAFSTLTAHALQYVLEGNQTDNPLTGNRVSDLDVLLFETHADFRSGEGFIVTEPYMPLANPADAPDKALPSSLVGKRVNLSEIRAWLSTNTVRSGGLELIVLGACETAAGDEEASYGLTGAAIHAGARSAMGSLWTVDWGDTNKLITAFFANYRGEMSKAKALRLAQLTILRPTTRPAPDDQATSSDTVPTGTKPYDWAPFELFGSWR